MITCDYMRTYMQQVMAGNLGYILENFLRINKHCVEIQGRSQKIMSYVNI